ncbi:hypothetical protein LTR36_007342 [Oleoguttula mirabilis]|uniref:Potassium channel domain-containing protein n=1 Tax=Oleoguttula mirabilis TaxID=1507867 RepID=A0AAV9J9L5_9PEZI|nr:hypothetical protein LTR36_007342 [Oleoguttula mirabilis]
MSSPSSPQGSSEQTVYDDSKSPTYSKSPTDFESPTDAPTQPWHEGQPSQIMWNQRRRSSGRVSQRRPSLMLHRTPTQRHWWKFTLREWDDDEDQDWWFASTAIPLIAATIGPLANVMSIAALVTYWRMCLVPGIHAEGAQQCLWTGSRDQLAPDLDGTAYRDPLWCYRLNVVSLVAAIIGNIFLLFNFTNRIRYIIALPVTILMWYIAAGILVAITVSMEVYVPPVRPQQNYTQGFWYAVIAAFMYTVCSMLLMLNMLGYFLGHYPQRFSLTESQRTLILQTMLFFIWLAGGGAIFSRIENSYGNGETDWSFVNALYFSDVTILTVGFGDLYPSSDVGRGLVFPYSVGGIIMLGLMVSSISKITTELGSEKVIRRHVERTRVRTIGRTVTSSMELEHRNTLMEGDRPVISGPMHPSDRSRNTTIDFVDDKGQPKAHRRTNTGLSTLLHVASMAQTGKLRIRTPKLLLLREEKDRFDTMRRIQRETTVFKRWYALSMSILAFGLLWCVGAVVFWLCEHQVQGMTYFKALYFCYVSLLTIGYGDLAPQSNPGRPFFVFWSLVAVPTMTILVSDLGETVINNFKQGTFRLADFTVLPKHGVWREIVDRHPWLLNWLQQRKAKIEARQRLEEGFPTGPEPEAVLPPPTIDELAKEEPTNYELARRLPRAIRKTADDMKVDPQKRYNYEEWVEFTRLIRFSAKSEEEREAEDEEEGLIEWDWIGEDSPMMSKGSEAEFVLDRLCESMNRYIRHIVIPPRAVGKGSYKEPPGARRDDGEKGSLRRHARGSMSDTQGFGPQDEAVRGDDELQPAESSSTAPDTGWQTGA